jgi:hypothetical protein
MVVGASRDEPLQAAANRAKPLQADANRVLSGISSEVDVSVSADSRITDARAARPYLAASGGGRGNGEGSAVL